MFACVFDGDFGMGHSPSQAFKDMLGNRGETTNVEYQHELQSIDPKDCFFFEEIPVVITAKSGWDIKLLD